MTTRRRFGSILGLSALSASRVLGANERIRLGALATGGRCRYLLQMANQVGGCEIVAVNDVNEERWQAARQATAPQAEPVRDWRAVLDRKDVDAVVIGSPDHWHVPMTIAAVQAGKDVYVEKPLTRTIAEGAAVIAAVQQANRIVQVGYQQRSWPHYLQARDLIRSGAIGRVTLVETWWHQNYANRPAPVVDAARVNWKEWLGAAPPREFDPVRYATWRFFWDYGGGTLTDLFSHWVDATHLCLDDAVPVTAQASGSRQVLTQLECPDTLSAVFAYPKGHVVQYNSTMVTSVNDGGQVFRGTSGKLLLTRGRLELTYEDAIRAQRTTEPLPALIVRSPRDGTLDHVRNFLDCVRSRQQPNATVRDAVDSANAAHYGNEAYRTGLTVRTAEQPGPWRSLFDGRTLENWQQDTPGVWTVRDGMIVGRTSGLKYNDFLRSREEFGDFTLELEFRLIGGIGNSGIQFRSRPVPNSHEMSGYQADMADGYWGALYDESRRNRILAAPPAPLLAGLMKDGWNRYVINARGRHVTLTLNGIETVNWIEPDASLPVTGQLALQVHSGPATEVQFRGLRIREWA